MLFAFEMSLFLCSFNVQGKKTYGGGGVCFLRFFTFPLKNASNIL